MTRLPSDGNDLYVQIPPSTSAYKETEHVQDAVCPLSERLNKLFNCQALWYECCITEENSSHPTFPFFKIKSQWHYVRDGGNTERR